MKINHISIKRLLITRLIAIALLPSFALILTPSVSLAGGVAVRGPRGGGAAVKGPSHGGRGHRHVATPRGPASVHGTARRTTRRTMRRMYTLPRGYKTAVVAGTTYFVVSGVYYVPQYEGSTVVYVEVENP